MLTIVLPQPLKKDDIDSPRPVVDNQQPFLLGRPIQTREDDLTRPQLFEATWTGDSIRGVVNTGEIVIVKRCDAKNKNRELEALQLLMSSKNPHMDFFANIITTRKLHSAAKVDIVMQHGGVDLLTHFLDNGNWDESAVDARITRTIKTLAKCLCCLIKLHSLGMYHGDIKPENFVIDPVLQNVKLIDFECTSVTQRHANDTSLVAMPMYTLVYSHPRICAGLLVNGFDADMWSFGQMAFALYVGRSLLDIGCETERTVRQNAFYFNYNWANMYRRLIPEHIVNHPTFEMFVDFMNLMCVEHHSQRPPRADMMLLQHPFLCAWQSTHPL